MKHFPTNSVLLLGIPQLLASVGKRLRQPKLWLSVIRNLQLVCVGKQQRFKDAVASVAITVRRPRFAKCLVSFFLADNE